MQYLDIIKIVVIFGITWCIGLIPPILIRYLILSRPMGKPFAIGTCTVFWLVAVPFLSEALGNITHTCIALTLISFVSYRILRQGKAVAVERKKVVKTEQKVKRDRRITGKPVSERKPATVHPPEKAKNTKNTFPEKTASKSDPLAHLEKDALDQEFMESCNKGDYVHAIAVGEKLIGVLAITIGPDHSDMAMMLNRLADLCKNAGRHAEAEPLYRRSLSIMEKAFGPDHLNVAACLNHLADLYYAEGRFSEAEPLCERSLAIMEKVHGANHPDVLTSLENLSAVYRATGKNELAEHLEHQAVRIRAKSPERYSDGSNHVDKI